MKSSKLKKTWTETIGENVFLKGVIVTLLVLLSIAMMGWKSNEVVTRLVPPTLNEATEVAQNSADETYIKSIGLHIAILIGNVSPQNADFIKDALEPLLAPGIRNDVMLVLADQIDTIKTNNLTITFRGTGIQYTPATNDLWVTGMQTRINRDNTKDSAMRTVQMKIKIKGGLPQLTYIDAYKGQPEMQNNVKKS